MSKRVHNTSCSTAAAEVKSLSPTNTTEEHTMSDVPVNDSVFIIWSSSDPEVADNLAFMYAHNSLKKLWWGRVRLIIWGPSSKLTSENEHIQSRLKEMADDGVEIWACRACSDNYGVTDKLESLGLEVIHVGDKTTQMLRAGWKSLTF